MKTNIVGFPRIGEKRELKKVIEAFFKGEITEANLVEEGKNLRKKHWLYQKSQDIDFISSNDFSFYDTYLDNAILFNAIPKEYEVLGGLDRYFALAKGYQKDNVSLKALPMKKWFNTNYHYIVTSISDETEFKLNSEKIINEFQEAKELGIITKPVIIGPLTFLKLANITGDYKKYISKLTPLYIELFLELKKVGVEIIQIDEPILVTDLTEEDKTIFSDVYNEFLKQDIKIILQTYFGDVRDLYKEINDLLFYGVGIDLLKDRRILNL